ncbi:MAG TPA: hypothetical protein P5544_10330 [Candidatus Nanopelagicales bacterium]|nr:hypothetical protein [Candidatus Nanopelagicales bacterium]
MIEASELGGVGELLGRGGSAQVFRVDLQVPGDPRRLVFKELRPEHELLATGFSREALVREMTNAVTFRAALSEQERRDLDNRCAWPLDLVQRQGRVVGVVMPLIPADYFIDTHQNGRPDKMVRDLSVMVAADKWATMMGVDRSAFTDPLDRALILMSLVDAIARLHEHGLVFGDVSLKSAVFSPATHKVLLLDCDGTASVDDPARKQPHSPGFVPPEIANRSTRLQDTRTDVYKLALCIVRGLQPPSRSAMQATDPTVLKPILGDWGVAELHRALHPDPEKRPTAEELFYVVKNYVDAQTRMPVIHAFKSLGTTVRRGGDVVLKWDVSDPNLNKGYLTHPDGTRQEVDLTVGQTSVKVMQSGTFRLHVVAPNGGDTGSESEPVLIEKLARNRLEPLGPRIGSGVDTDTFLVDYRMPGDPRPLVFLERKPHGDPALGIAREDLVESIERAIQFRSTLSEADRNELDKSFLWPLESVVAGEETVGHVMPLIPTEYFTATHQEGQPPGHQPRNLATMIADEAQASTMDVDRSAFADPLERALILMNLARAVALLHRLGMVYGDLNLTNVLFDPTTHNVLLVDGGATASLGDSERRQANSLGLPPEIANGSTRVQDARTDVYKLALCIVRGLQPPSRNALEATDPGVLQPLLGAGAVAELRLALDADPDKRPTAEDLYTVLAAYRDAHVPPPVINYFYPLRQSVEFGADVVLLWDIAGHDRYSGVLEWPDGTRLPVDLAEGRAVGTASHSGDFRLQVIGPRGVAASQTQSVHVFGERQVLSLEADIF